MTTDGPQSLGDALDGARMTRLHKQFWLLAALGIMLDGFDFFIIGVANPLIVQQYDLSDALKGLVSAAAIIGAIFGAALLGPMADRIGRRRIFKYDLVMFAVFSVLCIFAWNVWALIAFRFALGLAIGLDYPVAASYLSEVLPARDRGRWVGGRLQPSGGGHPAGGRRRGDHPPDSSRGQLVAAHAGIRRRARPRDHLAPPVRSREPAMAGLERT
jgi:hypothetical protein